MEETSDLDLANQIKNAHDTCKMILKEKLANIFKIKMAYGRSYEVEHLILLARMKFVLSLMVSFVHNSERLKEAEQTQLFNEFNNDLKNIMANLESVTKTLA